MKVYILSIISILMMSKVNAQYIRESCMIYENTDAPYFPLLAQDLSDEHLKEIRGFAEEYEGYKAVFRKRQSVVKKALRNGGHKYLENCEKVPEIPSKTKEFLKLNISLIKELEIMDSLSLMIFQRSYRYHIEYINGKYHSLCGDISALAPSNIALFIKENQQHFIPYLNRTEIAAFQRFTREYFRYIRKWIKHDFSRKRFNPRFPHIPKMNISGLYFSENNERPVKMEQREHAYAIKGIFEKHMYFLGLQKEYVEKYFYEEYQERCLKQLKNQQR